MANYTDLFIATKEEVARAPLNQHAPSKYFPTVQAKRITPLELATLEAIVTGHKDAYELVDARLDAIDQNVVRKWENTTIFHLPDTLVQALSRLTSNEIVHAAWAWEDTNELRASNDEPERIAWITRYLQEICQLARRAQAEDKQMYLWTAV